MTVSTISHLSSEYVRVPTKVTGMKMAQVRERPVAVALVPQRTIPNDGDWLPAMWSTSVDLEAIALIGPSGNYVLNPNSAYDVWVKVTFVKIGSNPPETYDTVVKSGPIRTLNGPPNTAVPPVQFDLTAKTVNIAVNLGDDLVSTFTVHEDGQPYVWAGSTVEGHVRATDQSPDILETFFFDMSEDGVLGVQLTDEQIESLGVGTFYYSIRSTKNAVTRTWIKGALIIKPVATQDP